jgi:hypothetical protein
MNPPRNAALDALPERDAESYLRKHRRYKTAAAVLITNLTLKSKMVDGLLLNVSPNGMRIEACLTFRVGDAVRVDLRDSTVLAEVVHYSKVSERFDVGLKLAHSLDCKQFGEVIRPSWPL